MRSPRLQLLLVPNANPVPRILRPSRRHQTAQRSPRLKLPFSFRMAWLSHDAHSGPSCKTSPKGFLMRELQIMLHSCLQSTQNGRFCCGAKSCNPLQGLEQPALALHYIKDLLRACRLAVSLCGAASTPRTSPEPAHGSSLWHCHACFEAHSVAHPCWLQDPRGEASRPMRQLQP